MPTKYMVDLIKQVSVRLKKPAVVVFSDTSDTEEDIIIGVVLTMTTKAWRTLWKMSIQEGRRKEWDHIYCDRQKNIPGLYPKGMRSICR